MTEQHKDRAHAWLSASGSSIWINCPQSAVLSRDQERRSSKWADEGTRAHEVAEALILGRTLPNDVPGEMIEGVAPYVAHVLDLNRQADVAHVEKRLSLAPLWAPNPAPTDMFGTVDYHALVGRTLHVVDLKYGRYHVVEIERNSQLMFYGLAAYLSLSDRERARVLWVTLTIVQPRASHPAGPVRSWRIHIVDLLRWGYDEIMPLVERITSEEATLPIAEGAWCRWCAAAPTICPVKNKTRVDEAQQMFDVID